VVSASLLLFNIAMGAFVSAVLLGGGKVMTLPVVIQRTILLYTEYGMAAALAGMLMLFVFTVNILSVIAVTRMRAARFAVT
jgi:putative spermidine/putrescine transport system permease protein